MSYYPMLRAPGCEGWVGLSNFPPNNWEIRRRQSQLINVTWASEGIWMTKTLGVLAPGACKTITASDLAGITPNGALPLLSLTLTPPIEKSDVLPVLNSPRSSMPAWRASLGLSTAEAQTSYQGELDAFPPNATLLTFGPFLQFGKSIKNHLLLLNIEDAPVSRSSEVEIYDLAELELKGRFTVFNNSVTIVSLDEYGFENGDLPLIICPGMAAIPLYFSSAKEGAYLSLEHTHPPASLVVHGRRWGAQKLLKNRLFAKVAS